MKYRLVNMHSSNSKQQSSTNEYRSLKIKKKRISSTSAKCAVHCTFVPICHCFAVSVVAFSVAIAVVVVLLLLLFYYDFHSLCAFGPCSCTVSLLTTDVEINIYT